MGIRSVLMGSEYFKNKNCLTFALKEMKYKDILSIPQKTVSWKHIWWNKWKVFLKTAAIFRVICRVLSVELMLSVELNTRETIGCLSLESFEKFQDYICLKCLFYLHQLSLVCCGYVIMDYSAFVWGLFTSENATLYHSIPPLPCLWW